MHDTPRHRAGSRHRPLARLLGVLTAAVLLLVGLCSAGQAAASPWQYPRSAVPWSKVGGGWTVATWVPSLSAPQELYLVAPGGQRYEIAQLRRDAHLVAWSGDQQRVLYSTNIDYREVDLRTGVSHPLRLPHGGIAVGYSQPKGLAILMNVQPYGYSGQLERFGTDGRLEQMYSTYEPGAGFLDPTKVVETDDGTRLAVGGQHGLVLLWNDTGALSRWLHPAGSTSCSPVSWWTPSQLLADCGGRLWAVPVSGAPAHALTPQVTRTLPQTYQNEWRYSGGNLGLVYNSCGGESLVRFNHNQRGVVVNVPRPGAALGTPTYVGHHGDVVQLRFAACQWPVLTTLFSYNARTGQVRAELGPGMNRGSLVDAVPYHTDA